MIEHKTCAITWTYLTVLLEVSLEPNNINHYRLLIRRDISPLREINKSYNILPHYPRHHNPLDNKINYMKPYFTCGLPIFHNILGDR
ncbi:MAG: hypothetical protein BAJATHORv1_20139 [Candidatus Thorarchaeota archaeon]|nr:MAG: hypothetical protein BAJATHORv1_20139 [Candidatus Thorarchaeota archaeon]